MKTSAVLALFATTAIGCASTSRSPASYEMTSIGAPRVYAPTTTTTTTVGSVSAPPAPPPAMQSYGGESRATRGPSTHIEANADVSDSSTPSGGAVRRESLDESPAPSSVAPPEWRPGLATSWGENRHSTVRYTDFVRATPSPFEVAQIHYNDAHGSAAQAQAHLNRGGGSRWFGAYHDGIRISLRDEYGNPLPGYATGDQMYVLGQNGQRYTVFLENATPYRFEALVSVDGLDVIHGRAANFGSRGYIIPAHGHIEIDGWRRSQSTVAAFRFGSVGDSYAADRGDARNVGVVGVALFTEAGIAYEWTGEDEIETRSRANPFPGEFAPPPSRNRAIY